MEEKKYITKKKLAEYIKISLPTVRKFLNEHKDFLENNKINIEKVKKWIEEESFNNLKKEKTDETN